MNGANFLWLVEYIVNGLDLGERLKAWHVSFSVAKCELLPTRNNNLNDAYMVQNLEIAITA